jgi:polysaccharide pyruvyl transferase WcaK-like protein
MKTAARMADYRSYRDVISKDFMSSIGIDVSSDPVFPDLAFSLPVERRFRPRQVGGSRVVAVGVMTYYGWHNDARLGDAIYREYVEKITQFVRWLLNEGHSVRLIIGDRSDGPAAQRVVEGVTQDHIAAVTAGRFVATPQASLDDVLKELAQTDIVVATRFHNVVGAFMADRPVISLGYAAKNDVLLTEMGMGKFCQHIERFEPEQLIAHFREVSGRQLELEQQIRSRRLEYERRLSQQFADILPPERKQPIGAGIAVS